MDKYLFSTIAAISVALISSYFAYLKLQKEFSISYKKQIIEYLFKTYIENGFLKIDNYLSILYNICIECESYTGNSLEYKKIIPPFYISKLLDYRFGTNWNNRIRVLHFLITDSLMASGKPIPLQILELLELLMQEVAFFRNKQELNLNATTLNIFLWRLLAGMKFYRSRKKILLLTKVIRNAGFKVN